MKLESLFENPALIVRDLVRLADVQAKTVLEPAAGRGVLVLECDLCGAEEVYWVEKDAGNAAHLRSLGFRHGAETDFMRWTPALFFDRVVMNPPATGGLDVDHVTRAFGFLKPGGRLVALMSPCFESRRERRCEAFRELLALRGHIEARLPAGTFKDAVTDVGAVVVVLEKTARD